MPADITNQSADLATLNPFDPKALGNVALQAITALAQAKRKTLNLTTPLLKLPEAEGARVALKAAVEGGCPKEHLRELMKAAFGGDVAGQSNLTVGEAALFPSMEPELAQASILPDHEEGLERALEKAMKVCCTERPIEKAQVAGYTRTHMGKVIQVQEYMNHRQAAMNATKQAHATSDAALKDRGPEAHQKAVASHLDALRHHTEAHEMAPADVAQDHQELMEHHRAAARWHGDKAKGTTGAYGVQKEEPVRVATKAHHEASTRVVNGKVVQVKPYEDHRKAAEKASKHAEKLGADALFENKGVSHVQAAKAHQEARDMHLEAALASPSYENSEGHKAVAATHNERAWKHEVWNKEAEHKASTEAQKAQPKGSLTIKHLTRDDLDYKGGGRGYLGHEFRGDHTDKALIEAANHHGLDEHELETYAKSRPGRHDMDATTFLMGKTAPQGAEESDEAARAREVKAHGKIPHAKLVEHFHKAIGAVKNEKWFKEDAEERRNPEKK